MHEVGEELEEELEEIIPLYSDFTEIPCVNKICIDECLDQ